MAKKRACAAKNLKGNPCGASPLKPGTEINGTTVTGKWCRQHDQDLPDNARIGGKQPGAGRPPTPRIVDVLKERAEARADEVIEVYLDAMKATRSIVVGSGPDAFVEEVPDWPTRLKAVEALNDRSYGKPKQISELTGPEGGPIEHAHIPTDQDFHQAAAEILEAAGAIDT